MSERDALRLAEHAAREAGRLLAGPLRSAAVVSETRRDVRLEADRAAEDRIVEILTSESALPILAEERSTDAAGVQSNGLHWIVDPLDGTMNYALGIPFCCVSIGLWNGSDPVAGVVYDFYRDELFSGEVGFGASLDGSPIHVRSVPVSRAVLCTGFPAATDFTHAAVSKFAEQVAAFRKIRALGSAALSLAYVAAGRADVYFERDIRVWDVAAGMALVTAAGGTVVRLPSDVPYGLVVYAHNGACPWLEPSPA